MNNNQIYNLVRAITKSYQCAFSFDYNEKKIKIIKVALPQLKLKKTKPGTIIKRNHNLFISCKRGYITNCKIIFRS